MKELTPKEWYNENRMIRWAWREMCIPISFWENRDDKWYGMRDCCNFLRKNKKVKYTEYMLKLKEHKIEPTFYEKTF